MKAAPPEHQCGCAGFSYPIVLSVMGQLFTAIASFLVCPVFGLVNALQPISARLYITRILPMGLLMALTLFTGNAAYMHLSVSFIQMLKSMGPVITMAGLYFARVEVRKSGVSLCPMTSYPSFTFHTSNTQQMSIIY